MFLEFLPTLPKMPLEIAIFVVSILGAILLVYSQFVEAENRRDLIRMIGALALFVYALWISNIIFMLAMMGVFIAALIEFIEIYLGLHTHTPGDVREYIKRYKKYV